jgi:1-acyl-sn-glycerol-3-phosphate acyltransferase
MRRRLDHAWRVVATGFCFLVFGLAGLVLRVVLFPPMMLFLREPGRLQRAARSVTHHFFRFFVGLMRFVGVLTYELHGVERLGRPGQLVLANHPTLIDVVFLISLIPQSDCVVKAALGRNPFTRGPVRATGYITNDGGVALVEDARRSLASGSTLVIFPEGTRTPRDGAVTLQRGAANVAIRCRAPITPVVITCEPLTLGKGEKWYKVPPRRVHFTITVHDDIEVQPYLASGVPEPVAVRRLNAALQSFFEQESRRASA